MKTIQTQHPESTEHFHRNRKRIIVGLICVLIFLVVLFCIFSLKSQMYHPQIYETGDEVLLRFSKSLDDFREIANILFENAIFQELYEQTDHTTIFNPYTLNWQKYMTLEKYEKLKNFFEKYGPYEISYELEYLIFVFCTEDNEGVLLYYVPTSNEIELEETLSYIGQHSKLIEMSSNWYYRVRGEN